MNNDDYIKTYISRFEVLFLDQVRKYLESDTKNILYASAVQDFQKKLEETERHVSDIKSTLDQSLSGLQAVTLEKDGLKVAIENLQADLDLSKKESQKHKIECMEAKNQLAMSEQKITELKSMLETATANNEVIKNNYQIVLKRLQELDNKCDILPESDKLTKKKKHSAKDSDWTDGN
jgi:chromosome segregation ATPase